MTASGRETSPAGAHQAANGLVVKGLAVKGDRDVRGHIRYQLTDKGHEHARSVS